MIKSAKVLVAYEASHPSALDRQISVPTPGDNAGTSLFRAGYGSAGSITDSCGQVASLIDSDGGSTHMADYLYLGLGTVVQQDSPQASLRYTLIDLAGSNDPDTGDIYAGLDRFSRIKDLRWRSTSTNTDLSRIRYGYDRASSRIWRENPSDTNRHYDWLYSNDGMHRLHDAQRGQLNAGHTAITSPQFGQCWTLDETGNWQGFRQDDDGNGSWDLIQARTSNPANEITDIDNTTGPSWSTPSYDANGNTTLIPRSDLGTNKSMIAIWDAWNRLVKLINPDTSQTVAEFVYDGRNFRIVNKEYASGTLSATRHLYYTDSWQAIEERVNTSTTPERQHVWGIRYIDDLVLRERDTNADGTLDERLYHLPDANWNVTAVVDASGSVQERIEYTTYGQLQFLTPTFGPRNASSYDIRTTYTSREWIPEIKLYYFRNRWYDPVLGRFCYRDPIKFKGSNWNLFEFTNSRVLNALDPSGNEIFDPLKPKIPGVPPDYPRRPDGTPDIPIDPTHPDYPILWPDNRGPGTKSDPPPGLPKEGPRSGQGSGDGGGCTCNFPTLFHRQRPRGNDGTYPAPGKPWVSCTLGATMVSVYAGSCSNGPCCAQKTCGEVTFWRCVTETNRGEHFGMTKWTGSSYSYGCQ
jgi:RHS repeat-associated protein